MFESVSHNVVLAALIVVVGVGLMYMLDPTLFGILRFTTEGFAGADASGAVVKPAEGFNNPPGAPIGGEPVPEDAGMPVYADAGAAGASSEAPVPAAIAMAEPAPPANCYARDTIAPEELLPRDPYSKWAASNPQGSGDIRGKNFLSAGALMGVNTVGQSLRNANQQLRSDPPNPQITGVSIWNNSTIEPDANRRPMEIG